jgi:branched-chain amino acid transport system ATP-binding protein
MLAIGRGLMSCAKLLAVDEPSLGLAPNLRIEVFEKIKEINKQGIDILMVEQDITEASEYTDRIYLVEDGRILFEGTIEDVFQNPHVKEVFLGV